MRGRVGGCCPRPSSSLQPRTALRAAPSRALAWHTRAHRPSTSRTRPPSRPASRRLPRPRRRSARLSTRRATRSFRPAQPRARSTAPLPPRAPRPAAPTSRPRRPAAPSATAVPTAQPRPPPARARAPRSAQRRRTPAARAPGLAPSEPARARPTAQAGGAPTASGRSGTPTSSRASRPRCARSAGGGSGTCASARSAPGTRAGSSTSTSRTRRPRTTRCAARVRPCALSPSCLDVDLNLTLSYTRRTARRPPLRRRASPLARAVRAPVAPPPLPHLRPRLVRLVHHRLPLRSRPRPRPRHGPRPLPLDRPRRLLRRAPRRALPRLRRHARLADAHCAALPRRDARPSLRRVRVDHPGRGARAARGRVHLSRVRRSLLLSAQCPPRAYALTTSPAVRRRSAAAGHAPLLSWTRFTGTLILCAAPGCDEQFAA